MRNIIENPPCSCPVRFLVEKQPKGCYRVGEKVLYIRVSMFTLCPRNSVYIILIYNSKHIFRGQISKYRCQNPSAHVTQDVNPVLLYVKVLHIVYPSSRGWPPPCVCSANIYVKIYLNILYVNDKCCTTYTLASTVPEHTFQAANMFHIKT